MCAWLVGWRRSMLAVSSGVCCRLLWVICAGCGRGSKDARWCWRGRSPRSRRSRRNRWRRLVARRCVMPSRCWVVPRPLRWFRRWRRRWMPGGCRVVMSMCSPAPCASWIRPRGPRLMRGRASLVLLAEHSTAEEFASHGACRGAPAWSVTVTGWIGWSVNGGRSGCSRGPTRTRGCVAGRRSGIRTPRSSLEARLDAQVEAMFHDSSPRGCPTDLLEKQSFLRAHALLLLHWSTARECGGRVARRSSSSRSHQPATRREPVVDWGLDVELPHGFSTICDQTATVHTITVRNGVVIDAPGELNLGRNTRLANRAQRRALRGLYATCAIPGCRVGYGRTKLHHVIWWRHGGMYRPGQSAPRV